MVYRIFCLYLWKEKVLIRGDNSCIIDRNFGYMIDYLFCLLVSVKYLHHWIFKITCSCNKTMEHIHLILTCDDYTAGNVCVCNLCTMYTLSKAHSYPFTKWYQICDLNIDVSPEITFLRSLCSAMLGCILS